MQHAHDAGVEVFAPAVRVAHLPGRQRRGHRVDREVAPSEIVVERCRLDLRQRARLHIRLAARRGQVDHQVAGVHGRGPEALVPEQRPVPQPRKGEILIKVAAAGVNRPDVAQRTGNYPPPPGASDIPGLEIAGEVVLRQRSLNQSSCSSVPSGMKREVKTCRKAGLSVPHP